MDIILTQDGNSIYIPVIPEEYTVSDGQDNQTVKINAIGEVNLFGKPNLTTVSWSKFFPAHRDTYVDRMQMQPGEYVSAINRMKEAGPLDLHLLDLLAMHCTIESFEYGEKDGTGDIYYTLSLKKYIYITTTVIAEDITRGRSSPSTPRNGKTYTVKKGDNLLMIAKRELGTSDFSQIFRDNRDVIGDDPSKILPGTILTLRSSL